MAIRIPRCPEKSTGGGELNNIMANLKRADRNKFLSGVAAKATLTPRSPHAVWNGAVSCIGVGSMFDSLRSLPNELRRGDRTRIQLHVSPLLVSNLRAPRIRCQETGGTSWLDLTSIDIELRYLIEHWNLLSDEGKQRIAEICRHSK